MTFVWQYHLDKLKGSSLTSSQLYHGIDVTRQALYEQCDHVDCFHSQCQCQRALPTEQKLDQRKHDLQKPAHGIEDFTDPDWLIMQHSFFDGGPT